MHFSRGLLRGSEGTEPIRVPGVEGTHRGPGRGRRESLCMSTSFLASQLRQLQSQRNKLDQLRNKREQVFEKAIAEIEDLDEQIEALESGSGNGHAAPKRKARSVGKPPKQVGEIKVFSEAGRGRRQCPSCETYVGVRTPVCVCGYNFNTKRKGNPPAQEGEAPKTKTRKRGRQNGMTNRDAVISVLEEASSKNEKLRLGEVVDQFLKKYPSEAKKPSVSTMVSSILKALLEEGLVEKDAERRHSLKKVVAKKQTRMRKSAAKKRTTKKPAAKQKTAKKRTAKKSAAKKAAA